MVRYEAYFDIFSPLGVDHECDGRTDGQMDGRSNIVVLLRFSTLSGQKRAAGKIINETSHE